jgi:hypothetical protein
MPGWEDFQVREFDPDALAYFTAVETADGQALEPAVRAAINSFVIGCKSDGIWSAIKASCILSGARTLNGALIPLVGPAPTNFNFGSNDYSRKTGLKGNGTDKYLSSNRADNADNINSHHLSVYVSSSTPSGDFVDIGVNGTYVSFIGVFTIENIIAISRRLNSSVPRINVNPRLPGFKGVTRDSGTTIKARILSVDYTLTEVSGAPSAGITNVFRRGGDGVAPSRSSINFYSIGSAIDLAKLDARVSALMAAFNGAIA